MLRFFIGSRLVLERELYFQNGLSLCKSSCRPAWPLKNNIYRTIKRWKRGNKKMDFYEAVEARRTIRKFKGPATKAQLARIMDAAVRAPSSQNKQNWEFVMVDDPELLEAIAQIKYILNRGKPAGEKVPEDKEAAAQRQKDSFANASLVVVFCNNNLADSAGVWCSIENMLLAAAAEGLGSRIARLMGDAVASAGKVLKAPEGVEAIAAISIGIPAEAPGPRNLRPEGSGLHRNGF